MERQKPNFSAKSHNEKKVAKAGGEIYRSWAMGSVWRSGEREKKKRDAEKGAPLPTSFAK